jgi:4-amino-4-deoxy-L-arabinose transferase-like glycosyltransferase
MTNDRAGIVQKALQNRWLYILVPFLVIWFGSQIFLANVVFSLDYDEGVYLLTALVHMNGLSLYKDVFFSQPPLTMELLTLLIRLFGNSVFIARFCMILAGFVVIVSSYLIARELFNKNVALITLLLCGINYHLFNASAVVQMDMQSLALALLAMYTLIRFNKTKNLWWLVISATLFALTNAVKLLELFFIFPIIYLLIVNVYEGKLFLYERKKVSRILLGMVLYAAVFFLFIFAIFSQYHFPSLQSQVFGMGSRAVRFSPKARIIVETYFEWYIVLFLYTIAGLYQIFTENRWKAIFFIIWIFAQLMFHFLMSAWVHEHHLIVLFPILSMATAAGLDGLLRRYRRNGFVLFRGFKNSRAILLSFVLIFLFLVVIPSIGGIGYKAYQRTHNMKFIGGKKLQELIEQNTEPDDLVVTDEQIAIFRSGRKVDPNLIDTARKRIETGYLREGYLMDLGSEPKLVAFWTHRLTIFKGYLAYVQNTYSPIYEKGGRKVFLKMD